MKLFSDETLAHVGLEYDDEDSLAHAGVKGMKWGRRKAVEPGSIDPRKAHRQELRSLNKVARAQKRDADAAAITAKRNSLVARDKSILDARANLGASAKTVRAAKVQYKQDKQKIGSVAAKQILNKVKDQHYEQVKLAQSDTQREETNKLIYSMLYG